MCPGLGRGLKFILNSLAKVVNNWAHINVTPGFASQNTLGKSKILITALDQFKPNPSQRTEGSKIENKFPILF